ncbi:MAG: hypothetical protein ACE5KZ_15715 [Candidatus Scalinduaceae bacterium]
MKYFQYGALELPKGKNPEPIIYAYGHALNGIEDHMLLWRICVYIL